MPNLVHSLTLEESAKVAELVALYVTNQGRIQALAEHMKVVVTTSGLGDLIHSFKWRVKEPSHLLDKLTRKLHKCKQEGAEFDITAENLFLRINDLAGVRLLHLHTREMEKIDAAIRGAFLDVESWVLHEPPFAHTWDNESKTYFESIGIATQANDRLYTSVHYVVKQNSKSIFTGEIQVRTLAEEIWGEVDHSINYPHPSDVVGCKEQIKVLARVASSCSRLVDSIFATHEDAEQNLKRSAE